MLCKKKQEKKMHSLVGNLGRWHFFLATINSKVNIPDEVNQRITKTGKLFNAMKAQRRKNYKKILKCNRERFLKKNIIENKTRLDSASNQPTTANTIQQGQLTRGTPGLA